ncbi:dehydrodolichyl diphosphate syntase complex subunit nus1 [Fopius arisanus]|uniref:ditrans,polycis-polyprenyl diphosphate synthase [(2E,6E)-farnesyldiphosphate specific] n=1 Tax=Fopius arisanus TaxID=64838 RepID=A0A9R1STK6_9HYME|nr:PREDICTED: dehydrodolichyl diphosphate syntase complex subunit nus1 [Fopius arisanus]
MSTLLHAVLPIVHFVYSVYLVISTQWALIQSRFWKKFSCTASGSPEWDVSGIKKLPGHLAVVVGFEDVSFVDLAKIICWTASLRIPHVSFYDLDGVIKKNSSKLRREFEILRPNLDLRVTWEPDKTSTKDHTANEINGFTSTKVHFLSYDNGKHGIIEFTKELSHAVSQGFLKTSEIDIKLIDEKLQYNFPDPDLAIVCGKTFSTFGVLPWHIRVTEFVHLSTHHDVTQQDFMNILVRYDRCEQRYGK